MFFFLKRIILNWVVTQSERAILIIFTQLASPWSWLHSWTRLLSSQCDLKVPVICLEKVIFTYSSVSCTHPPPYMQICSDTFQTLADLVWHLCFRSLFVSVSGPFFSLFLARYNNLLTEIASFWPSSFCASCSHWVECKYDGWGWFAAFSLSLLWASVFPFDIP